MDDLLTLNLEEARDFVRKNKLNNGLDETLVIDAINSIPKRLEYLKYFYDLYLEVVGEGNLALDRIGVFKDERGILLRHKYESIIFAFLSNLHELIDSYPFIYLGIHAEVNPIIQKVGWDRLLINNENLKTKITKLKGDQNFNILKELKNFRKHGALPVITNHYEYLEININFKGQPKYKNLTNLLYELHNKLIPQYFDILKLTFKSQ